MQTVCSTCGTPYERGASKRGRCPSCLPPDTRPGKVNRLASGYDAAWTRLSSRARRLQPFCSDCGRLDDLTADHTPEAWQRKAAGLPIRLRDVDVVCRSCNTARGAARGEKVSHFGGQGRPLLVDPYQPESDEQSSEQCDGKCEGHCPEHRNH